MIIRADIADNVKNDVNAIALELGTSEGKFARTARDLPWTRRLRVLAFNFACVSGAFQPRNSYVAS